MSQAMEFFDSTAPNAGQPPNLESLIGQRVKQAWVIVPVGIFVLFENGKALTVELVPGPAIGVHALKVSVGDVIPGADWSFLGEHGPHCRELQGKAFTGLDGQSGVMSFGNFGAAFSKKGVHWLKKAQ